MFRRNTLLKLIYTIKSPGLSFSVSHEFLNSGQSIQKCIELST